MAINPLQHGEQILFTMQEHDADRAGLHYDIRLVHGDKAYSWATRKQLPEVGKAITLWEQPVHTASYALSPEVEIPKGNYGAGKTILKFVRKARIESHNDGTMVMIVGDSERYLIKKLDKAKYGKGWLFKNLGPKVEDEPNKYLEKIARIRRLPHGEKGKLREIVEGELSGRAVDAVTPKKKHKKHKHLEKTAIALTLYECPVTQQRKWTVNGRDVPAGWVEVKKTYKKFPKKA